MPKERLDAPHGAAPARPPAVMATLAARRRNRGGKHRYDFEGQGRAAVWRLSLFGLAVAITYGVLHWLRPAAEQALEVQKFVAVSPSGLVSVTSPEDIDWYVGPAKATPILTGIDQRNREIVATYSQLRQTTTRLVGLSQPQVTEMVGQLLSVLEQGRRTDGPAAESPAATREALATLSAALDRLAVRIAGVYAADAYNLEMLDEIGRNLDQTELALVGIEAKVPGRDDLRRNLEMLTANLQAYRTRQPRPGFTARPAGGPPPKDAERLAEMAAMAEARATEGLALLGELRREMAAIQGWRSRLGDPLVQLDFYLTRLASDSVNAATAGLVADARQQVARLSALRQAQADAVAALQPPVKLSIFWMTPRAILMEIIFWGLFGVITNLLLNIAEVAKDNRYTPAEWVVAWSKIIYGPAISLVLCLAILTGLVHLAGEEIRAWALPLVSFFFGFNARKSAALVDRLSARFLGATREAIDRPEAMAAAHAKLIESYTALVKPASLTELRSAAQQVAEDTVRNIVFRNEARL